MEKKQVGLIGLGTMGRGLTQALARAGLEVHAHEPIAGDEFSAPDGVALADDLKSLVTRLVPPRRVLLMVTAGDPVDSVIGKLTCNSDVSCCGR